MLSDIDHARFHHQDLQFMESWELDAELGAVHRRLYLERDPFDHDWLLERRAAILDERRRRGRRVA